MSEECLGVGRTAVAGLELFKKHDLRVNITGNDKHTEIEPECNLNSDTHFK